MSDVYLLERPLFFHRGAWQGEPVKAYTNLSKILLDFSEGTYVIASGRSTYEYELVETSPGSDTGHLWYIRKIELDND